MRIPFALSAAALIAIAAAACSGGQSSNYVAPPAVGATPQSGLLSLSQSATVVSAGTVNGVSGILTFGSGSGTITTTSSATVPNGLAAVTTSSTQRIILADSTANPSVFYVTILSPTGATLSGLPGVSLTLPSPATSTYQEAQWNGTKFVTVPGATPVTNPTKTAISFPATTTPVTIAPTGAIYLAFYQNGVPPPSGPNVLADTGFESGVAAPAGSAVTSTGWTTCTITAAAPGVSFPAGRPLSSFTPVPGGSPIAAFIETAGTSVPQGTKTPLPTVTAVPVNGGTHAAVFGEVFNNFQAADYAYNGLCQALKMPAEPSAQLQVLANGTENDKTFFALQVDVLDSTGRFLANVVDENQIATTPPGDTGYRQVNILQSQLSAFSGQNVQLFVGMWTKAGSSSGSTVFSGYYFVDDVMLFGIQ